MVPVLLLCVVLAAFAFTAHHGLRAWRLAKFFVQRKCRGTKWRAPERIPPNPFKADARGDGLDTNM